MIAISKHTTLGHSPMTIDQAARFHCLNAHKLLAGWSEEEFTSRFSGIKVDARCNFLPFSLLFAEFVY